MKEYTIYNKEEELIYTSAKQNKLFKNIKHNAKEISKKTIIDKYGKFIYLEYITYKYKAYEFIEIK